MKRTLNLLLLLSCLFSLQSQNLKTKWILGSFQTHLGYSFDVYANYQQKQMLNQVVSPDRIDYSLDRGEVRF